MVVNSLNFLFFFVIVFLVYYFPLKGNGKMQNGWLLLCSYVFYGIAAWKMIPLLLMATVLFYVIGIGIGIYNKINEKKASLLTTAGTLLGVGFLLYFKYLNFFIESFSNFFNAIGLHTHFPTFNILMPLGISFFTFKLISYVIEVHRKHMEPCRDFVAFATYISFFPTILSGPIDRPKPFISQLKAGRIFDYPLAVDGCRQILWGMFKKMVVADNIAIITSNVWGSYNEFPGIILVLNALLYTFQMYADFSGYSDMAIGVGKLLGLRVAINFKYPFFALNIADYWRRWHISLTSWLTDYVFMPLNIRFRNYGRWGIILAIVINLVLVGMWHGANMTFAVFGLYHGLLFIPLILTGTFMKKTKERVTKHDLPYFSDFCKMVCTYLLVSFGLIIFAATDITAAGSYCFRMFSTLMEIPTHQEIKLFIGTKNTVSLSSFLCPVIILITEWKNRKREYAFRPLNINIFQYQIVRILFYAVVFVVTMMFAADSSEFIYFKF